jgi:hypothetical protein
MKTCLREMERKAERALRGEEMKDVKDMMRIVGIILLGMFVLAVGVPLVFAAAGIVLSGVIQLAIGLIKIAVVLAIGYLILVGIRAVLR